MPGQNPIPENPRRGSEGPEIALPSSGTVPLDGLIAYASEVIARMADARDVRSDDEGEPIFKVRTFGVSPECTFAIFEVDFSAIGMATDMPLVAHVYSDSEAIEWHFGPTPIASTPRGSSPEVAARTLDMNTLLDGFRRFVLADSVLFPTEKTPRKGREGVFIDPKDGTCCECGEGELEVIDADDVSMTVECSCGACYPVEHDAFGDGAVHYLFEFLSSRRTGRDD